jgi:type VI secretion system protein ImpM
MKSDVRSGSEGAIGWHGKLPTVGDFATRRLDPAFVAVWDAWISRGLELLQIREPDHWQEAYLTSPTWRFVVTPGFLPSPLQSEWWTGVLMPSVDRVGRFYPLTLAFPLSSLPMGRAAQRALWSWLQQIQDAAVDALEEDWSIDVLDAELLRLGLPPECDSEQEQISSEPAESTLSGPWAQASMEAFFAACAPDSAGFERHGRCIWYNEADLSTPRITCCPGMGDSVVALWRAVSRGEV